MRKNNLNSALVSVGCQKLNVKKISSVLRLQRILMGSTFLVKDWDSWMIRNFVSPTLKQMLGINLFSVLQDFIFVISKVVLENLIYAFT